jgi:hypothetical protein
LSICRTRASAYKIIDESDTHGMVFWEKSYGIRTITPTTAYFEGLLLQAPPLSPPVQGNV